MFCSACSEGMYQAKRVSGGGSATETEKPYLLRVMTYNVRHCNPPSMPGYIDVDAIVKTIQTQEPDVVALQEIDVFTRRSGEVNQAEIIAEKLNMHFFFGKAIDYNGGEYGVAILSKYPLSEAQVYKLPMQAGTNGEPRVLATARVTLPGDYSIRFGSTHLDALGDSVNRMLQVKEINRIAASEKLPFIIAGDFNALPESGVMKELDEYFTRTCHPCEPTFPVVSPQKVIDYVAYSPVTKFKVVSTLVIPEHFASDHLPVVAEIHYTP